MPKNTPLRYIDQRRQSDRVVFVTGGGGGTGVTDHGALTGLGDDDHVQYLTTARGDARYVPLTQQVLAGDGLGGGGTLNGNNVTLYLASSSAGAGLTYTNGVLAVGAGNGITVNADDVALASSVAGAGLAFASGVLSVNVDGLGLSVASDNVTLASSSNPSAAASILASASDGSLQLAKLMIGATPAFTLWGTNNVGTNPDIEADTSFEISATTSQYYNIDSDANVDTAVFVWGTNRRINTGGTELMRLAEDGLLTVAGTVRTSTLDTASGNMTIQPSGDLVLDPDGNDVLPGSTYAIDLGDYNRKWKSLYAGELKVDVLVAQEVISTIGGRIEVTPTTQLIADLAASATTMDVKHNNLRNGEFAYLMTAPGGMAQFEAIKVNSAASAITGGYRYTILRNRDGTGANDWYMNDAIASLGMSNGEGFLSLTATSTVMGHDGPTLAVYARNGASWNSLTPTVAVGNLSSFAGYGTDEYGIAIGNDVALEPGNGFKGLTADKTNGLRLFSTDLAFYSGSPLAQTGSITSDGTLWFGPNSGDKRLVWDGSLLSIVGSITASSGTIAGWTIDTAEIKNSTGYIHLVSGGAGTARIEVGTGSTAGQGGGIVSRSTTTGVVFWAGQPYNASNTTMLTYPFTVTSAGTLTAADATITGTITASAGSFTGALTLGTSGGIYQGTGTFATPTKGMKIYNSGGFGEIDFYSGGLQTLTIATGGIGFIGATGTIGTISNAGFRFQEVTSTADAYIKFYLASSNIDVFKLSYVKQVSPAVDENRITLSKPLNITGDTVTIGSALTLTTGLTSPYLSVASGTGYLKVATTNVVTWSTTAMQSLVNLGTANWTALEYNTEFHDQTSTPKKTATGTVYYKKFGDMVMFRGTCSSDVTTGNKRVFNLPAGTYRSGASFDVFVTRDSASNIRATIDGTNNVMTFTSYTQNQTVFFDGLVYYVDA